MKYLKVGIIMGSQSDWSIMKESAIILEELRIPHEKKIISAHRTPDRLWKYGEAAIESGIAVIIAGAGGAAHLPGMMASKTQIPVIGVPIPTKFLRMNAPVKKITDLTEDQMDDVIYQLEIIAKDKARIRNIGKN